MSKGNTNFGESPNGNSTETTETTRTETTGAGDTNSTAGVYTQEVPQVVMVETSEPVKRGRGRPRKDGSSPETVKSDVPRVDKSKAQSFLTANDLNPILEGVFGLVSMRFGDVWKLSPAEAESISKPLVKILEKMNLADRVSQMSDGTALVFALVTIIAPRIMLSASTKEQKKEKVLKENGGVTSEQSRETSSNSKNNIREIGRKPSDGEYVKALSTQLNFGY